MRVWPVEVRPLRRVWVLIAVVLAGGMGVPFVLTEIPPVLDYPNHLARAYVLAFGPEDPVLSRIYAARWAILPNLALDLVLPVLLRLFDVHVAGRLMLAASLVMPVIGLVVYNRVLFGRLSLWPLASAVVAFNGAFLLGFMNFLVSVGVAFLASAVWVRWRERAPAAAVLGTAGGAACVFFCHVAGLFLLLCLIAGSELDRLFAAGGGSWRQLARRVGAACGVFAAPGVLFVASPTAGAAGPGLWLPPAWKPLLMLAPVMNYDYTLDACSACLVIGSVCLGVRLGWLLVPRAGAIAMGLLLGGCVVAPFRMWGGAFVDYRLVVMLGYLVFAAMRESPVPGRAAAAVFAGLLALSGVRIALLAGVWQAQAADAGAMRAALGVVPPGSRVLVTTVTAADAPGYWQAAPRVRSIDGLYATNVHLPVLLLMLQRAMPQTLFTDPSQQPVAVLPPYRASSGAEAGWGVPSYTLLADDAVDPAVRRMFPYLDQWTSKFDFVVVVNAGGMTEPGRFLPARLALAGTSEVAAVYRVVRPGR